MDILQPVPELAHSHTKNILCDPQGEGAPCVSVCAHCLWSGHWTPQKRACLHLLLPFHEAFVQDNKILSKLPTVKTEQSQTSHSILTVTVIGGPELDLVHQIWPHQCLIKGKDHLLLPACSASLKEAQISSGFSVASAHHGFIDSFLLEKTLNMTESNH